MTTRWNGDISLLKDTDIASITIDFEDRTFSATIRDSQYSMHTGHYGNFTNVSPFGYFARGMRRMVSDKLSSER